MTAKITVKKGEISLCDTDLSLIGELNNKSTDGKRRLIVIAIVDALGSHIARENSAISGKASNGESDVIINLEDLLLVRRKLGISLIDASQNHMGFRSESYCSGTLLHGLHRVLDLEEPPSRAPCRHVSVVLVPEHPLKLSFWTQQRTARLLAFVQSPKLNSGRN